MATYGTGPVPPRGGVDPGRLWAGGIAASLVAGGVAAVGYLFVRGVLDIPMLSARPSGRVVEPSLLSYAALAVLAGILATGLAYVLVLTTPRPHVYFGWIIGLATAAAMLVPLSLDQSLASQLATATVNLAVGITIGVLVSTAVGASRRRVPPVYDPLA
ncbi:hypothetical protein GCM10009682_22000 [Luedemannella flava]|uniref:Uncharacterized protein n=1 Tax=Luedemannella flava TaxID=349316 RepID=A0ABP4Y414_9ACTN